MAEQEPHEAQVEVIHQIASTLPLTEVMDTFNLKMMNIAHPQITRIIEFCQMTLSTALQLELTDDEKREACSIVSDTLSNLSQNSKTKDAALKVVQII